MEDGKNVQEFAKTVTMEEIFRSIRGSKFSENLCLLFDKYPICEVRKAIVREMLICHVIVCPEDADWIEQRIVDLKEEKDKTQSNEYLWRDLLSWYVFNVSTRWDFISASRAIEFAINITKRETFGYSSGFSYRSDVLKIIAGKIKNDPSIYWEGEMPALEPFLVSFLNDIHQSTHIINDEEAVNVKRVIDIAIATEDCAFFLPHMKKVLSKASKDHQETLKNHKALGIYDAKRDIVFLKSIAELKVINQFFEKKLMRRKKEIN